MRIGDLVRMTLKDGAITSENGIFLGDHDNYGWKTFLINGKKVSIYILDYNFEVVSELVS